MSATRISDSALDERLGMLLAGDRDATRDPYPLYADLRKQGPVYWYRGDRPFVTTHEEARRVFLEKEHFHTFRGRDRFNYAALDPELRHCVDEIVGFELLQMNEMNGESHRRVRAAAQRAFPRSRIIEVGEYVQRATDALLDRYLDHEEFDFMDLARRLPVLAIGALIGAPPQDVDMLKQWGDEIAAVKPFYGAEFSPDMIRRARDAVVGMKTYVADMVDAQRGRIDKTALITALLDAEEEDRLSQDELAGTISLFIYAAHETTTNMLGMGLFELLTRRDQWAQLKADASLIPGTVEEILRFDSPVQMMTRLAVADAEIGGDTIEEGTSTMVLYASANRDDAVFDNPDVFDVERAPSSHLGLGHGVHICIGNALARIEGKVVLETMTTRFDDIELTAEPESLPWNAHPMFRGVLSVPLRVRGDRGAQADDARDTSPGAG